MNSKVTGVGEEEVKKTTMTFMAITIELSVYDMKTKVARHVPRIDNLTN